MRKKFSDENDIFNDTFFSGGAGNDPDTQDDVTGDGKTKSGGEGGTDGKLIRGGGGDSGDYKALHGGEGGGDDKAMKGTRIALVPSLVLTQTQSS